MMLSRSGWSVRTWAKRAGCTVEEYERRRAAGEWRCCGRLARLKGGPIAPHWATGPKPATTNPRCDGCKGRR